MLRKVPGYPTRCALWYHFLLGHLMTIAWLMLHSTECWLSMAIIILSSPWAVTHWQQPIKLPHCLPSVLQQNCRHYLPGNWLQSLLYSMYAFTPCLRSSVHHCGLQKEPSICGQKQWYEWSLADVTSSISWTGKSIMF